ncbi:MAG: hypothetical protein AAF639_42590 [Chloroflexota bacterium]
MKSIGQTLNIPTVEERESNNICRKTGCQPVLYNRKHTSSLMPAPKVSQIGNLSVRRQPERRSSLHRQTDHRHHQQPRRNVRPFYPPPPADLDTPWTIHIYNAFYEQDRWERHNHVANQSYADRDLNAVGKERIVDVTQHPTYVAEATINGIDPVGGVRVHTPDAFGELPLHEELMGYIDMDAFRTYTDGLLHDGIAHASGLWVDVNRQLPGLGADLARACFVLFLATGCKWYIGAGHQYVQNAWASLGWYAEPDFGLFPYPDDRYDSYVLNGTKETWVPEFVEWAATQIGGASLDGAGVRFTVEPMRVGMGAVVMV